MTRQVSGDAAPVAETAAGAATAATTADKGLRVTAFLHQQAARALGVESARLPVDRPLVALGLDSLGAAELAAAIESGLGVEVPLADLLQGWTLAELSHEVARLLPAAATAAPLAADAADTDEAAAAEAPRRYPLSHGQRALAFLDRVVPGNPAYVIAGAARLAGALPTPLLRQAFQELVRRHPALRTTFELDGEEGEQVVHDEAGFAFREVDATGWSEARLALRMAEEAERPFDLARGPLLRLAVFHLGEGERRVVLAVHHLVADFWSLGVLLAELGALHRGETLPPLAATYADFVRRQTERLASPEAERLAAYWSAALPPTPPPLELPTDLPRPLLPTFRGGSRGLRLAPELAAGLHALGRAAGATPFMTLLALYLVLLHRTSGQEEILVGTPTAGRGSPDLAQVVGYFVNPVVLRGDLAGDPTFPALLNRVKDTAIAAFAHQGFPFPLLAERLSGERDPSRPAVFQTMLVLYRERQDGERGLGGLALGEAGASLDLGGLRLESVALPRRSAQLDLTLFVAEVEGALAASLEFASDLFDAATAERMLGQLRTLATAIAAITAIGETGAPGAGPVSTLPLLSPAERHQLLVTWNETGEEADDDTCLHQLFEAQAARTPAAPALLHGTGALTYGELDRWADRLARHLRILGVGPDVPVGVCLERRPEMVAAILAVLKAGGAYVPLDPAYPAQRLGFMVEDTGMPVLVTREPVAARLPRKPQGLVDMADFPAPPTLEAELPALPILPAPAPRNLAYVIYTSGSTGRAKGVAIAHASAVTLVRWAGEAFATAELARVLAATSICFDLSVFELFVPLAGGGAVVLAENALALPTLAAAGEVTLVNTVPSVMAELVRAGGLPASVRTVNLAGEALPRSLVEQIYQVPSIVRVVNLYGPSEDTTYSTWAEMSRTAADADPRPPAIGRPIRATRAYVVDRHLAPLPPGIPGELLLGGAGLARGYLGRPDLTAQRFVPDPFGTPGGRLYQTGDLARFRADGDLEYLGRIDRQVKIRGFRIEPGEIEAALRALGPVQEAAVVVRRDAPAPHGDPRLVAFVVLAGDTDGNTDGGTDEITDRIRSALRGRLPGYMVPGALVLLPALPLSPNGKVDHRALARIEVPLAALAAGAGGETAAGIAALAPRTPIEERLAGMWAEVLGLPLERIGSRDDFFTLGGHSLLATRLISRVRRAFGIELPMRRVFECPTLEALAQELVARGWEEPSAAPPLVPHAAGLQAPLSYAQERIWFLAQLAPESPAYNLPGALHLAGSLDRGALARCLQEIVRRHEILRSAFPLLTGEPTPVVLGETAVELPWADLSALGEAAAAVSHDLCRQLGRRVFDLGAGPLLRTTLLCLGPDEHVLVLVLHHIVADGWSVAIFLRELSALYSAWAGKGLGEPSPLAELPMQYRDFARWQRDGLAGEALEAQLAGWRQALAGAPDHLSLPADRPRPPVPSLRGGRIAAQVPAAPLAVELQGVARSSGATLFMVLLATFDVLLYRHTGQEDLVVGSPIANRERLEIEGLIGCFVNVLALRADLAGRPSFGALLERVRQVSLAAYAHQDLPFEKLVETLAPRRDLATPPLFQVLLVLQNAGAGTRAVAGEGLAIELREIETATAKFDLTLEAVETPAGIALSFEYSRDLFDAATIARLAEHYRTLLAAVAEGSQLRIGELPLLSAGERQQLLEWNATALPSLAAVGDAHVHLLDRDGQEVPIGVPGEIHVGGVQVARGDLGRPELTAERFVPDPFAAGWGRPAGARLYRTGDLARHLPDGALEFLGRTDDPARQLDRLHDGKRAAFVAPRPGLEALVASFWSELLGVERVGAHDDFFALGGHSLLGARLVGRLRQTLGVELPLNLLFARPTVTALAREIEERGGRRSPLAVPSAGPVRRNASRAPLSFSQERLWFLAELEPDSAAYNIAGAVGMEGPLAVPALSWALDSVVRRHEASRTTFSPPLPGEAGAPQQVILPPFHLALPVIDLAGLAGRCRDREADRLAADEARRPFRLAGDRLLRAQLLCLTAEHHLLLLCVHHVVSDGRSHDIFLRDLAAFYASAPLPELPYQFADWASWEREQLTGERLAALLAYWRDRLSGATGPDGALALPTDRPRPAKESALGGRVPITLPAALVAGLEALGRSHRATLFMTVLAALDGLLYRYTGKTDLLVGTPVANRPLPETEQIVGFFVNTLVLRSDLSGRPSFGELLERVRRATLADLEHQELPFAKLVLELAPRQGRGPAALIQVMLALLVNPLPPVEVAGLSLEAVAIDTGAAKFDLTFDLALGRDGGLAGSLEYRRDLFDSTTAVRIASHLAALLAAGATAAERHLGELPLLTAGERQQILAEWAGTAPAYPRESTLAELFAAQALARPDTVVAVFDGHGGRPSRQLSFGELDRRAGRLARRLRALGVGPEVPVGLWLERSLEMVVAVLGVIQAGGAYVPLDPSFPRQRLELILDETRAPVLLADRHRLDALPAGLADKGIKVLCLDSAFDRDDEDAPSPAAGTAPDNLAYVMYTSGSTGVPKGVAIGHRGIVRLVRAAGFADLGPDQVFLHLAPLAFDASTPEIWSPLLNGGRLVVFPPGVPDPAVLDATLARHGVTTLWLTAGLFHQMVESYPAGLGGLGQLLAGGDVLSPPHVRRTLVEMTSGIGGTLLNCYGPTENTTFTCCHRMATKAGSSALGETASVPIGRPIGNTSVHLLDRDGQPVPVGVPGELVTGGDGLARGYLGRPDLTAERFVPAAAGGRLYKTGDLVRYRPDGTLEFLGRIDQQVKIRGFRIELGEIEASLSRQPEIAESAVVVREVTPGDRRLVAYVVARPGASPTASGLRAEIERTLPAYMVPAAFVFLPALPLTENGKVDRRALPEPGLPTAAAGEAPSRPLDPREELLAALWGELLGVDPAGGQIGPHDDFFALGGHSLLATRLVSRIRETFRVDLPLGSLFEAPTLAEMAGRILGAGAHLAPPILAARRLAAEAEEAPAVLSYAQERIWFLDRLTPGSAAYNVAGALRLTGELDPALLGRCLGEIARRHEVLRSVFPLALGRPSQVLLDRLGLALPRVDLSALGGGAAAAAQDLAGRLGLQPFDLAVGPLLCTTLLDVGPGEHLLVVVLHHIAADGWSVTVFLRELTALYGAFVRGLPSPLPELPIQYSDFVRWQRDWLTDETLERQLVYWRQALDGAPPQTALPTDRPRPPVPSFRGAHIRALVPAGVATALRRVPRKSGATLFMTLLSAFDLLLHRHTGQEDLVVGSPIANRER
ncbi:MAG TPA: amino acid adenylation domain-containing protein, partial [Thermoanaerobaculia bacterium]|nr:amino acid adenylation domain-containing protein [Thermoanaerobaculia bacterium]